MMVSLFGHRFQVEQGTPQLVSPVQQVAILRRKKADGGMLEKSSPLPGCGGGGPEGWRCGMRRGSVLPCRVQRGAPHWEDTHSLIIY